MSLKELTYEHHRNAERQQFVKVLMSGSIDPKLYATFMYNQHQQYNICLLYTSPSPRDR